MKRKGNLYDLKVNLNYFQTNLDLKKLIKKLNKKFLNVTFDHPVKHFKGNQLFDRIVESTKNGWIGYTWSKTDRQFDDLNSGDIFPATYDRRHDLSVVLDYTLNDMWSFGFIHVYATGNSITLPIQRYFINSQVFFVITSN